MLVYLQNIKVAFLLLTFTSLVQMHALCSKSNKQQMVVQQTDTVIRNYLALGDSYTIGESVSLNENYPNQTVALLNNGGFKFSSPKIIAITGWTTANLLSALAAENDLLPSYDIVTLLIGVNNQYQGRSQSEYKTEFTTLLQKSIAFAGNKPSHVIVLSIPDYSVTPFASGRNDKALIAAEIDSFNTINKQVSQKYGTNYLYITDETRKAATDNTLLAADGLHYSGKEYAIWSSFIASMIKSILK